MPQNVSGVRDNCVNFLFQHSRGIFQDVHSVVTFSDIISPYVFSPDLDQAPPESAKRKRASAQRQ
jgi:hypothetical protein